MLADLAYVRDVGRVSDRIPDAHLTPHLVAAGARLAGWVGATAYADAGAEAPVDPARATALKLAEAHLALAEAIPSLTAIPAELGFAGGASAQEGQASYLTPTQVAVLQEQHLHTAERLARPYLVGARPAAGRVVRCG